MKMYEQTTKKTRKKRLIVVNDLFFVASIMKKHKCHRYIAEWIYVCKVKKSYYKHLYKKLKKMGMYDNTIINLATVNTVTKMLHSNDKTFVKVFILEFVKWFKKINNIKPK